METREGLIVHDPTRKHSKDDEIENDYQSHQDSKCNISPSLQKKRKRVHTTLN